MTHAIDAFRGVIGGGWVNPVQDLSVLGIWLLIGVAMGLAGALRARHGASTGDAD